MRRERPEPSTCRARGVARARASASALALVCALAPGYGCGKSLTEDDCRKVADNLRVIWTADAKRAAAAQSAPSDKGALVIKSEGDKLVADWTSECKRDLMGHRVSEREVTCLLQAKSIEQLNACNSR